MKYIDIHSHLNLKEFDGDREEVLSRMKENDVGTIVIGVNKESSLLAIKLSNENKNVWASIGIHPTHSKDDFDESFFEKLLDNKMVVAIGECGLDYSYKDIDRNKQKVLFEKQIDFAVLHNLPLMLHVRDAHEDVLKILEEKKKKYGQKLRGNSHFFTASREIAERYFNLGFTISFTGLITYNNSFDDLIRDLSLSNIHAETDSPFVAPLPYRGKRNEPTYVKEVVKKIAEIKAMDEERVRIKLFENANRVFNLEDL